MKTFKEYREISTEPIEEITEEQLKNIDELGEVGSRIVFELQELVWKLMKLMYVIIKFLVVHGIKTIWGSGKFVYNRYNKQARADRRFDRQLKKTNDQVKKLRLAKAGYENAVLRLEGMKSALDSMDKESLIKHDKEIRMYKSKIADIQREASAALKKLKKVS